LCWGRGPQRKRTAVVAFLDVYLPDVSSRAGIWQFIRVVDRLGTPKAVTVRWMLRLTTFFLMLLATLVGVQLAMSAPSVSPVSVSNQQLVADHAM
jgi:cell division septal protein FtsQ